MKQNLLLLTCGITVSLLSCWLVPDANAQTTMTNTVFTNTLDIGSPAISGTTSYNSDTGVYTVSGGGSDIWYSSDQFRFVYVRITGDCDIRGRVASLQNTHEYAKAGVMIRESLSTRSAHALANMTPAKGAEFLRRTNTSGSSYSTTVSGIAAPHWVRLARSGNTFTTYHSADGTNWANFGSQNITMSNSA